MTDTLDIGFSWSATTKHWVAPDQTPHPHYGTYKPLCGRGIELYVPGKSRVPEHLTTTHLDMLKWCQACTRRVPVKNPDDPENLPPGTVIYYNLYYDGLHHQLAEKLTDGGWHLYSDDGNYSTETLIPNSALDRFDINVVYRPPAPED